MQNEVEPREEEQPNMFGKYLPLLVILSFFNIYMTYNSRNANVTNGLNTTLPEPPKVIEPILKENAIPNFDLSPAWNPDTNPILSSKRTEKLIWDQSNLYFDWNPSNERTESINITLTEEMQNNKTIYAHILFISKMYNKDKLEIPNEKIVYHRYNMTKFIRTPLQAGINLLNSTEDVEIENQQVLGETYNYWKGILNIDLVYIFSKVNPSKMPLNTGDIYKPTPSNETYYPVVFINEINVIKDNFIPINKTLDKVQLQLYYNTYSQIKHQMQQQIAFTWNMQVQWGMAEEAEFDEIKRIIYETNIYLLAVTMIVSVLHSLFDFLAFKNDISFWNNARSYEGLSIRSLFLNVFTQLVVLLYLMDNETSFMILASSFIGLLIEAWKIRKALRTKIYYWNGIPLIKFRDRVSHSKTKEYDEQAMKYLMMILNPLIILYAIYTLYYNKYKSWYSWVISSLTSFVYTFGFIMMTPQLFINYKLKSVAHLPWRAMAYKSLNTFIDDLFSFVVKMPIMHRIACLRDDVIFFIYLYQRWIYPVDKRRRNEYGLSGEEEEKLTELRKLGIKNITLEDLSRPIESLQNKKKEEDKQVMQETSVVEGTSLRNRKNENKTTEIIESLHRSKYEKILALDDDL